MPENKIIAPGATIGILGDGQLGKMIAMAAAKLGYKVAVLGPGGRESPAGHVAYWAKAWGASPASIDEELLAEFLDLVSVVLIEWENVPISLVERIEARKVPVRPSSKVLAVAQDRFLEKECAEELGIPAPFFLNVETDSDVATCTGKLKGRDYPFGAILKTRRNGYDGKGQIRLLPGTSVADAWGQLNTVPCILEEVIDFACEVSVIVARTPDPASEMVAYGPFQNEHENGILRATTYPMNHPDIRKMLPEIRSDAREAALQLADHLDVHGLLAVEFFVTKEGRLIFNEMAPRPHNSGHLTIECCDTSQFEQYVRAACGLPLGSACFHSSGCMVNILGDEVEEWLDILHRGRAALHMYGKDTATDGRKMGHVTGNPE